METNSAARRTLRTVVRAVAWVALNLVVLEVATRGFFAVQIGPRVLLYGTSWQRNTVEAPPPDKDPLAWSPQSHRNVVGDYRPYTAGTTGYSKYFPYEHKWTGNPDGHGQFPVRINNHGLRGEDFTVEKPPGTFRILTLGASSTFGYHDPDDETYPVLLQRELTRTATDGRRYEVINFGVPHATSDNILALFLAEGLPLDPDMVTFYEGANDSAVIEPQDGRESVGWRETIADRFLLGALLDRIVPSTDAADADWWWSGELAERRTHAFIANLERLAAECRRRNIRVVVCTQQMKSTLIPPEELKGLTYDQEVERVRQMVADNRVGPHALPVSRLAFGTRLQGEDALNIRKLAASYPPRALLVHTRLMAALRTWVPGADVGFVDVIHELDARRDLLVNWVHLRGEANGIIAQALAREIRSELAGQAPARSPQDHS